MASEIFNYSQESKSPKEIANAANVIVKLDNNVVVLAQSVSVSFGRQVQNVYEIGSVNIYLAAGAPSGNISLSRAVGLANDMGRFVQQVNCGKGTSISIEGINSDPCQNTPNGLRSSGAVLSQIGVSIQAGAVTVTDQATFTISNLK